MKTDNHTEVLTTKSQNQVKSLRQMLSLLPCRGNRTCHSLQTKYQVKSLEGEMELVSYYLSNPLPASLKSSILILHYVLSNDIGVG